MPFDLATLAKRARKTRRKSIVIRDIVPPATLATDLYRACYLPVIQTVERLANAQIEEYARSLTQITTDSAADLEREQGLFEAELQRLVMILTPRLQDWAYRVERWQRGKWRGAVLSATGIDLQTLIGPEGVKETVETVIARNVALIKDVGRQAQGRIADSVFRGINQRRAAVEVAREIRDAVAMSRRRSIGIASHQMSDLSNRLADERRREAGITKWKWMHSRKKNPREEHQARDGKEYTDKTAPADLPGALPYCGCRSLSVIEFD